MFKHILVPTDDDALSVETAKNAVVFAREIGAKITFLYEKPDYPATVFSEGLINPSHPPQQLGEMSDAHAQQILKNCEKMAQAEGVSYATISSTYDVLWEGIVETATKSGCDIIFMASHDQDGLKDLVLGSVTHKVLTHSKIPVLVYR